MKVLIADDHHVVRRGLLFFLKTQKDIEVVGEAANGVEAVELAAKLQPDIVLMDLVMPEMDGIQATRKIKEAHPQIIVLMLTSFSDRDHIVPAMEAGAAGYQLKDIEPDDLVDSLRMLMRGEHTLHPKASSELAKAPVDPLPHTLHPLTPREAEVLAELTKGKSNREVASALL
jgi:DNA-binding NarL/FixJ family response regulator